jgi:hypothetical protein
LNYGTVSQRENFLYTDVSIIDLCKNIDTNFNPKSEAASTIHVDWARPCLPSSGGEVLGVINVPCATSDAGTFTVVDIFSFLKTKMKNEDKTKDSTVLTCGATHLFIYRQHQGGGTL